MGNYTVPDSFFFQIFDKTKENAHLAIALDNARLAADDFRVK